ncbi:unnamed protein product [Paramecium octaurelia]|uniref:Uncharacterized protein n=1 Tax=Paramecium octaurelia TaxID=43137 RepID=A0A8S1Y5M2_PAROT|nr:unnamed protein product [Paramecium octaurelia]
MIHNSSSNLQVQSKKACPIIQQTQEILQIDDKRMRIIIVIKDEKQTIKKKLRISSQIKEYQNGIQIREHVGFRGLHQGSDWQFRGIEREDITIILIQEQRGFIKGIQANLGTDWADFQRKTICFLGIQIIDEGGLFGNEEQQESSEEEEQGFLEELEEYIEI